MKDPKAIRKAIMTAKSIASLIDPKFARVPLPDIGLPAPDMVVPEHSTTVHSAYDVPMPQKYAAGGDVEGRDLNQFGLYSHAAVTAGSLQKTDSPENYREMLLKRGVKPSEFDWSGYDDAFAGQPQVTREQVAAHFHENKPLVVEKVLQDVPLKEEMDAIEDNYNRRWNEHRRQMHAAQAEGREFDPDSEQYIQIARDRERAREALKNKYQKPYHEALTLQGGENYREILLKHGGEESFRGAMGHFGGEPDVLASLMVKDHKDHDGDKVMHIDELQSDWAQRGRKQGFKPPKDQYDALTKRAWDARQALFDYYEGLPERHKPTNSEMHQDIGSMAQGKLPVFINPEGDAKGIVQDFISSYRDLDRADGGLQKAPYVTKTDDWVSLGLKRAFREAAEKGYDKLAWSPGSTIADRYDLAKHVSQIRHEKNEDGTYNLDIADHKGNRFFDQDDMQPEEVVKHLGKGVAQKVFDGHGDADETPGFRDWRTIKGDDLHVGDQWPFEMYDRMIPKQALKLAKQHDPDASLAKSVVDHDDAKGYAGFGQTALHAIRITPRMRESILKKGFAAYAAGGEVYGDNSKIRIVGSHEGEHRLVPISPKNTNYRHVMEYVPLKWLLQHRGNDYRHSEEEMERLRNEIEEEGLRQPVLISVGKNRRTAVTGEGNHRVLAAYQLGYTHIPARAAVGDAYHERFPEGAHDEDIIPQANKYFPSEAKPSRVMRSLGYEGQPELPDHWWEEGYAAGGDVEGYASGGDIDPEKFREHLKRIYSPLSEDPEIVRKALQVSRSYSSPVGMETGTGSLYNIKQSMPAIDVNPTIEDIPGISMKKPVKKSWEDFYQKGKGGVFINMGGDLSNFGRLTHINGKKLAWPVDLHAGTKFMLEPNPKYVWGNAAGHSTAFENKIRSAERAGKDVYGIFSPMGPSAVNSSHNMFDALMAQIPDAGIDKKHMREFDTAIKRGDHLDASIKSNPKKLKAHLDALKSWPGLENAKEASEFARPESGNLTGTHRTMLVKFMDKADWLKKGLPEVGVTRAAITDPELKGVGGNKIGHRVVKLSSEKLPGAERSFEHSTYPTYTSGEYEMDVPLVQRHYAAPDVIEQMIMKPTKAGQVVHPYSDAPLGRATARKLFEEQKQMQPINPRFLDSVMTGMENQEKYGFKAGGSVRKALMIAKGVKKK